MRISRSIITAFLLLSLGNVGKADEVFTDTDSVVWNYRVIGLLENPCFDNDCVGWINTFDSHTATHYGHIGANYQTKANDGTGAILSSIDCFMEAWAMTAANADFSNQGVMFEHLGDGEMSQLLTALPTGTYTLTADVMATSKACDRDDIGGVFLFISDGVNEQRIPVRTSFNSPEQYSVMFTVTEPTADLTFGLRTEDTNAEWVAIDNVCVTSDAPSLKSRTAVAITGCQLQEEMSVNIPAEIDGMPVTKLWKSAFYGNDKISDINIPKSISIIDQHALRGTKWYDNLEDGVIYINNILYGYKGTMPDSTDLVVRDGTTFITPTALMYQRGLRSVVIPEGVQQISCGTFQSCSQLESVKLPNSLVYIGGYAFANCSTLQDINLPSHLFSIGFSAFSFCSKLNVIEIPSSVKLITYGTFNYAGCKRLLLHEGMQGIAMDAFANFTYNNDTEELIKLPSSIVSVGPNAFAYSQLPMHLQTNSLKLVSDQAFWRSMLTAITPNVEDIPIIGPNAFMNTPWGYSVPSDYCLYLVKNDGTYFQFFFNRYNWEVPVRIDSYSTTVGNIQLATSDVAYLQYATHGFEVDSLLLGGTMNTKPFPAVLWAIPDAIVPGQSRSLGKSYDRTLSLDEVGRLWDGFQCFSGGTRLAFMREGLAKSNAIYDDAELRPFLRVLEHTGYDKVLDSPVRLGVFAPVITEARAQELCDAYDRELSAAVNPNYVKTVRRWIANHIGILDFINENISMLNGRAYTYQNVASDVLTQYNLPGGGFCYKVAEERAYEPNVYDLLEDNGLDSLALVFTLGYDMDADFDIPAYILQGTISATGSSITPPTYDVPGYNTNAILRKKGIATVNSPIQAIIALDNRQWQQQLDDYDFDFTPYTQHVSYLPADNRSSMMLESMIFPIGTELPKGAKSLPSVEASNGLLLIDDNGKVGRTLHKLTIEEILRPRELLATNADFRVTPLIMVENTIEPRVIIDTCVVLDSITIAPGELFEETTQFDFSSIYNKEFIDIYPIDYGIKGISYRNSSIYFELPNTFSNLYYNVYLVAVPAFANAAGYTNEDVRPARFRVSYNQKRNVPRLESELTSDPNDNIAYNRNDVKITPEAGNPYAYGSSYFQISGNKVDVIPLDIARLSTYSDYGFQHEPTMRYCIETDIRATDLKNGLQTNHLRLNRLIYVPFLTEAEARAFDINEVLTSILDNGVTVQTRTSHSIFDLNGRKLAAPQRGINIVRTSDGRVRKMMVK